MLTVALIVSLSIVTSGKIDWMAISMVSVTFALSVLSYSYAIRCVRVTVSDLTVMDESVMETWIRTMTTMYFQIFLMLSIR